MSSPPPDLRYTVDVDMVDTANELDQLGAVQGSGSRDSSPAQLDQASQAGNGQVDGIRSSSPLHFPSSSPTKSVRSNGAPVPGGTSSPLHFPSSSPSRPMGTHTPRRSSNLNPGRVPSSSQQARASYFFDPPSSSRSIGGRNGTGPILINNNESLFFPTSGGSTPRRNRRGEIHSSAPSSSPSMLRRMRHVNRGQERPGTTSDAMEEDGLPSIGELPNVHAAAEEVHSSDAPSLSQNGGTTSDGAEDPGAVRRVIWGTNVSISDSIVSFRSFLREFRSKYRRAYDRQESDPPARPLRPENDEDLVYEGYLRRMRWTSQTNLNLDATNLLAFPPTKKLYYQLWNYPQEIVPIMDQVLKDTMIELGWEDRDAGKFFAEGQQGTQEEADAMIEEMEGTFYKVRPFGGKSINMRDLNPGDIDKLVTIRGLVIRATPIMPDMKMAFFRCLVCNHTLTREIDRGRIEEPDRCPRDVCNSQGTINLIHNRCEFSDRQVIRLQETPDAVPDGQTPHTVSLVVYDELVDLSKPGDRIEVTGIFRGTPVRPNPRQRTIKSLFKTFVDVVHIKRGNVKRVGYDQSTREDGGVERSVGVGGEEDEAAEAEAARAMGADGVRVGGDSSELEAKLVEISKRADVYDLLSRSLAPSIYELDDVKRGILLQLFGGSNKSISRGGGSGGPRYRGDINVLLVGDPGTSKSQILQYVHKIAPRGIYTSGKGSSAVGLTAYVTRDPDTKQLVLESGALVLSDGGVCCIDEFDKMSDATRSVLHEVMEQQTVSIAKAGIITTLNARTSILAAANPVGSRYDPRQPITRNIDLPPTLISRFDLLYLVLDKIDEANDRRLAKHLVGLYLEDRMETGGTDILPLETLTAYISHARTRIYPMLTEGASNALVSAYVQLRKVGEDPRSAERRITATTRQLESMIRLSEAHARMRFSDTVDVQDVEEASRLLRSAIQEAATDPITGAIDLDLINTGHSLHQRKMRGDLRREVLNLLDSPEHAGARGIRYAELVKALETQSSIPLDVQELGEIVKALEGEGLVKVSGERDRRMIRRITG